jgi:hypothetical protein
MNNVLQSGYDLLRAEEKRDLRQRLADSPRAILLLDFLEDRKGKKFNTVDAVNTVYGDEREEEFTTLRNRFFKLRKHIIETLDQNSGNAGAGVSLLPLEEELFRCRQMIGQNHFQQADKHLKVLIAECKRLNVFELLPEAYNQIVYANLALNNFREHERNLRDLEESSKLLDDMRSMQVMSRRIYLGAITRNTKEVVKQLQAMRRIVLRRSAFPRYELFYHFVVVTNAPSVPGYSGKGHARHLASLKKLIAKHPGMPSGHYEPNGAALMQYYLLVADGSHHFMRGDVQTCYNLFKESWDIMERIPNLKLRKSESNFKNRIAHDLIEFQKENKNEEKRMSGYAELAVVYSYAYPTLKCPDPEFLARQLKAFTSLLRREKSVQIGDGLSTQAIFAFMNKDWKLAKSLMQNKSAQEVFSSMDLDIYNEVLILSPASGAGKIKEVKKRAQTLLDKSFSSDRVYSLRRVVNLMGILENSL